MNISRNGPSRPGLRYHGAKWLLASWIIDHIPSAHDIYIEPFGGSGAVLLRKDRSPIEIYNDLDGDVVNYFRILREDPDHLIRAIKLTPFAKEEWELSHESVADPIERARRFYVKAYMNIAGATAQCNSGWRRQKKLTRKENGKQAMVTAAVTFAKTEHLYQVADRLRGVTIENDTAAAIFERYDQPEAVFYIDPPYVFETRGRWKNAAYNHEMNDQQHTELAKQLHSLSGMVLLSGYRCSLCDELYNGWQRIDKKARVNGVGSAVESLWLNSQCTKALEAEEILPLLAWGNSQ